MKNKIQYALFGTILMVGSLTFLGAGSLELARTGMFDGVAGVATLTEGYLLAQGGGDDNPGGGGDNNPGGGGDDNPPGGTYSGGLTNPLKSSSLQGFLLAILDILLVFALPIIVLFIMYAGFMYVIARGDEHKIEDARRALTWSVIGGVIIFGAKLIVDVIHNTVNAL